ncbi:hypothetical protein ALC57_18342 [Trachymyrmex cornetzi]|uniref:Uncharacterized protein n=1 Tax=Trachymyrmex cornetzi TaxID=471704 RepID=A0A151ISH1_9HYME|nr:hypothetical protein ALC57_18342 [Trachymyrmex cornetzi]
MTREQILFRTPRGDYSTRSRSTFYLRVKNNDITTGYVPSLSVCDGIYLGDALVTNRDGKAFLQIINTTDAEKEIAVPSIQLREVESIYRNRPGKTNINIVQRRDRNAMIGEIRQLLRRDNDAEIDEPKSTDNLNKNGDELGVSNNNIPEVNDNGTKTKLTTDTTYDSDTESEELFNAVNIPFDFQPDNVNITFLPTRDNIASRKDNIVIFITARGEALDKGAKALADAKLLPVISNAILGRARVLPYKNNKQLIALVIKNNTKEILDKEILDESIHSLLDVVKELSLESLSICNSEIDGRTWDDIRKRIHNILYNNKITIKVCKNEIVISQIDQRKDII